MIKNETREDYHVALQQANEGSMDKLFLLIHDEMEKSLKLMLEVIGESL